MTKPFNFHFSPMTKKSINTNGWIWKIYKIYKALIYHVHIKRKKKQTKQVKIPIFKQKIKANVD